MPKVSSEAVRAYFDRQAPDWDQRFKRDPEKLRKILTLTGIMPGEQILDLGCGTGVLFPYYLERDVGAVLGVDLSPEMIRVARNKIDDPRIRLFCGDVREVPADRIYDHCMIYDAFPHFASPWTLIERLTEWLVPGGRLTIANGKSQTEANAHHQDVPETVARMMPSTEGLSRLLSSCFDVDRIVEEGHIYLVSGKNLR